MNISPISSSPITKSPNPAPNKTNDLLIRTTTTVAKTGFGAVAAVVPLTVLQFVTLGLQSKQLDPKILYSPDGQQTLAKNFALISKTTLRAIIPQTILKTSQYSLFFAARAGTIEILKPGSNSEGDTSILGPVRRAFGGLSPDRQKAFVNAFSYFLIGPTQQIVYGNINNIMQRVLIGPSAPKMSLSTAFIGVGPGSIREGIAIGFSLAYGKEIENQLTPLLPSFLKPIAAPIGGFAAGVIGATGSQWAHNLSFLQVGHVKAEQNRRTIATENMVKENLPKPQFETPLTKPYVELWGDHLTNTCKGNMPKAVIKIATDNLLKRAGVIGFLGLLFNTVGYNDISNELFNHQVTRNPK